jgi:isoaspartyl peptidase/L-asparaginase-like protein (Ntn-hydrolase superfamily)
MALDAVKKLGGTGGLIAIDKNGEIERIVVVPRLGRPPTFASQANTKA